MDTLEREMFALVNRNHERAEILRTIEGRIAREQKTTSIRRRRKGKK